MIYLQDRKHDWWCTLYSQCLRSATFASNYDEYLSRSNFHYYEPNFKFDKNNIILYVGLMETVMFACSSEIILDHYKKNQDKYKLVWIAE